ncbi:SH3 domain-containing protein [Sphingomonas sp. 28-62-20]|uniref:SH3 domain-containing protein n=1 Tax=Sphingomonas sp. 28-62-20 TaxID=1970433 RepID=UPI0035A892AF
MKSSSISSGQNQGSPPNRAPHKSFALGGPTTKLDPRTTAVRADLADVRLADHVFAPHYAAPMAMTVKRPGFLRATSDKNGETLAEIMPGAVFEALDFAGDSAWGIAVDLGLVGYVDRNMIDFVVADA